MWQMWWFTKCIEKNVSENTSQYSFNSLKKVQIWLIPKRNNKTDMADTIPLQDKNEIKLQQHELR